MEHYAGIDVSLEQSSVCVVDAKGQIVCEAKVASEPEALVCFEGRVHWVFAKHVIKNNGAGRETA